MKRDRVSMEILSVLKESDNIKNNRGILTEMPQKLKIRKKVKGYDFKELNQRTRENMTGNRGSSLDDVRERFSEDAKIDLNNRFDTIAPGVFSSKYGSPASYSERDSFDGSMYLDVNSTEFAKFVASKFPELEIIPDAHSYDNDFSIAYSEEDVWHHDTGEKKLRGILSNITNFDDLRRQSKKAIDSYLLDLIGALKKAILENIREFSKKRKEYDKYTNLSAKEKEDELSKNWYDQHGRVIRAKNLDESFIKELGLTEATDLDVEDYLEIYDFEELSDYAKERIADRKVRLQIQKMFDRMTEILETEFTEYMSQRGLTLEPGQFDIEDLLYNMTHERTGRWSSNVMTKFYITKGELMSYINNNTDLAEMFGQKEIDRLLKFLTTDKGDSQPVYTISYDGGRGINISGNFNFKRYNYDSKEDEYFEGADEKLKELYENLQHELSLDFYSSYKLLDKAMKQLREEAKEIVYSKLSKSKDKYLSNGEKFDKSKYDVVDEEPSNDENEK